MSALTTLSAFLKASLRARLLSDRRKIDRYQERQIARLIRDVSQEIPFYKERGLAEYVELPVISKVDLLKDFDRFNQAGLDLKTVRHSIQNGQFFINDHNIGHSTGTSGNRGYYVISDAERYVWLGTILAKALPDALWHKHRVALALPNMSDLYNSAQKGSRIDIRFFDLAEGVENWVSEFADFAPDTIVAPPKVLRFLAEHGHLKAVNIFSGAEVLDPLDREIIETNSGRILREIYMATEGLFAVSCPLGALHLAEDVVKFEFEPVSGSDSLVSPIITDFTRRTQAMIRYRMNDLMELSDEPCPCGSAFQHVKRIAGRQDDVFQLAGLDGIYKMVSPDILRNIVVDTSPDITDFQIIQRGAKSIEIILDETVSIDINPELKTRMTNGLERLGVVAVEFKVSRGIVTPFDKKLRRVRREWSPPG